MRPGWLTDEMLEVLADPRMADDWPDGVPYWEKWRTDFPADALEVE
jgi:hypothetical protein